MDQPFRQKARFNDNGSYITRKQLKFLRLGKRYPSNTHRKLKRSYKDSLKVDLEWVMYYNLAYDLNEIDPKAAFIYWNHESEQIAYKIDFEYIKECGELGNNLLDQVGFSGEERDEEDFGTGLNECE